MNDEKQLSVHAFVVPVTPFQQNCSIIWCTETKKGAVIDPGGDIEEILNAIKKKLQFVNISILIFLAKSQLTKLSKNTIRSS